MKNETPKFYRFIGKERIENFEMFRSGFFSENVEVADGMTIAFWVDLDPTLWEEAPEEPEIVKHIRGFVQKVGEGIQEMEEEEYIQAQTDFEIDMITDFSIKLMEKFDPPAIGAKDQEIFNYVNHIQRIARHLKDGIVYDRQFIELRLRKQEKR